MNNRSALIKPDRPSQLLAMARALAASDQTFQAVRGPGKGNNATNAFMQELRDRAVAAFGTQCGEQRICGETSLAVDFYFQRERTIVEVALGLPNPGCEYEKDILKAIMAQDLGYKVRRLFFISRAGAVKKCEQPGRRAVKEWARSTHKLLIEVHELGGEPRLRRRRAMGR
jgi:hypothetical protein